MTSARLLTAEDPLHLNWLVIPGVNPEPWELGHVGAARRNGKLMGTVSPSPKLKSYQADVRESLAELLVPKIEVDTSVHFWFWRRIDTWVDSRSGKTKTGNYADSTNLQKSTEDALQGLLFGNDRGNRRVSSEIVEQGLHSPSAIVIAWKMWEPPSNTHPAIALFRSVISQIKQEFSNDW